MEVRHLKYFIRAAELLHFTKAAESLYVSQPSLSVQIKQLEDELGIELFARVGRNVRLTDAGEAYLIRAREAVAALELGAEEIDAIKGVLRGKIHIGAVSGFGSKVLPSLINEFRRSFPEVYVRLSSSTSDIIERGLLDGTFGLGLTDLPPEHNELQLFEVLADRVVVAVNHEHPLANSKDVPASQLNNLPIVVASQHLLFERGAGYMEAHGVQPHVVAESEEADGLWNFVRTSDCAALAPQMLVPDDLIIVPLDPAPPPVRIGLVWDRLSPAANEFVKQVRAKVQV